MLYDLIIIGGGPAGITAGIYAARQKLNTLLITKDFAGQVARKVVMIENYPGFEEISGLELIKRLEKHLRKQKIDIERDEVIKLKKIGQIFFVKTKSRQQFQSRAVIIASGADPRPLEVPGEKKYLGRGVSYCASCDAPLFEGKTVVVIGGGNAGFETALFLAKYAKKIYILEASSQVTADLENQERVKKTGKVEVIINAKIKKIQGNKFVNSIVYQTPSSSQKPKTKTLSVQGVFVAIGSIPATGFVKDLVDFNEKDEIIVDPFTGQTRTPGLFAAGDADNVPFKQIVIAAGEGAKAALSAYHYLLTISQKKEGKKK